MWTNIAVSAHLSVTRSLEPFLRACLNLEADEDMAIDRAHNKSYAVLYVLARTQVS